MKNPIVGDLVRMHILLERVGHSFYQALQDGTGDPDERTVGTGDSVASQ